jgi:hypothetical protein
MRRINNFFCTIIQVIILYFEKLPKMLSEAKALHYSRSSYLQNIPINYIEAIYEIVSILKTITGMEKRTSFFYGNNNFDAFVDQLIDLGYIQFCMRAIKDLNAFLFNEKLHTVVIFMDYLIVLYLNTSHLKLSKSMLIKIVNEICELFSRQTSFALIQDNRESVEVKEFLENLVEITKRHPNLLRDTFIEMYLSQLGLTNGVTLDNNFKILNLNSPFGGRMSRKVTTDELAQLPPQSMNKTTSWLKVDLQTSNYDFVISPVKERRISNSVKNVVQSDPFDEFSILSLIDYYVRENNTEKVNKIIKWRKRILEVTKINGWLIGKILAANTLNKFEINDIDIIEANLNFMEKFNSIEKGIKTGDNNIYKEVLEEYENLLIKSLEN